MEHRYELKLGGYELKLGGCQEPGQEVGKSELAWGPGELGSEPGDLTLRFSSAGAVSVVKSKCSRV